MNARHDPHADAEAVLLDLEAWDNPAHLSSEECSAHTGPDWRRRQTAHDEDTRNDD